MRLPCQIGLVVVLTAALVYMLTGAPQDSSVSVAAEDPGQPKQLAPHPVHWTAALDRTFQQLTERRVQHLTEQTDHRAKIETAVKEMPASRREAQLVAHSAWRQVVEGNFARYEELRAKAKQSPNGVEPCSICDGKSYMACVMCKERDGRCITCSGSGTSVNDGYCPACLGTKKCYLCSGSGRMFCPFCNDGVIEAEGRPPSSFPPGY